MKIREKKNKFKVFFVSIDPERDSPEVIKNYLNSFENKIYGITGDPKKYLLCLNLGGFFLKKFLLKMETI